MRSYLINPAIQLTALFAVASLIICLTTFVSVRAYLKLKTKSRSITKLAEDGERVRTRLERYTSNLSED